VIALDDLPQALKRRRMDLGLTQGQVARRAGTSTPTLCRYESGWKRFEVSTLRKLAAALDCRLEVDLVPRKTSRPVDTASSVDRLGRLFWDRKLVEDDLVRHPRWVVARVVEHGNLEDIRFLVGRLGTARFLELTGSVRYASKRAARFWQNIRTMEAVTCTKKRSPTEVVRYWRP